MKRAYFTENNPGLVWNFFHDLIERGYTASCGPARIGTGYIVCWE